MSKATDAITNLPTQPPVVHDFGDDAERAPASGSEVMTRLTAQVALLRAADKKVAEYESLLKSAQAEALELRERIIPATMDSAGIKKIQTEDGIDVSVETKVRASLPKDPAVRGEAFAWLDEHGHGELVKHTMTITFNKGDEAWRKKFVADCAKRKVKLNMEEKKDIHNSTLCAFLRQQQEDGVNIPLEKFGAYNQRIAKLKA